MSNVEIKPIWLEGAELIKAAKQILQTKDFDELSSRSPLDPDSFSSLANNWLNKLEKTRSNNNEKAVVKIETRIALSQLLLYMATPETDEITIEWVRKNISGYETADIKAVERMIRCLLDSKKILAGES